MADRIAAFACTVPAGTPVGSPVAVSTPFVDGIVTAIDIRVPPGPSGLVGFTIAYGGQAVIPDNAGTWLIADDEKFQWPTENYPTGRQWSLIGYNTDVYDHTIYVRYLIDEFTAPAPTVIQPLAIPLGG
jgi:hypothetical protein